MRTSTVNRTTKETDISVTLNIDGSGKCDISTGIGFFDHMLTAFTVHGGFDLTLSCKGDLEVDTHHTVEDCGIVLGKAFAEAVGDKAGIDRFGSFYVPMDEALGFAAVDISGRPYLKFDLNFTCEKIGELETETVLEFWRAFAMNSLTTLHIKAEYFENNHHICEAIFKAAAQSLRLAVKPRGNNAVLSTKGVL